MKSINLSNFQGYDNLEGINFFIPENRENFQVILTWDIKRKKYLKSMKKEEGYKKIQKG